MGSMYLRTGSVVSSSLGEPGNVLTEAKKVSVIALIQMHHQKAYR